MNISHGLKVKVGVDPQETQQVVVSQDSDAQFLLEFFDEDGNPLDVTAATVLSLSVLEHDGLTILVKALTTGIALVAGINNRALVTMLAADFALLSQGNNDAEVKLSLGGVNYAFNLYAALNVQPSVI